jgi:hypothetical protein
MDLIYQWIDLLWLPLVFYAVHKQHRLLALGFLASCMLMMRLQIEIMEGIGYGNGIVGLMQSSGHTRALMVYSLAYFVFFIMAYYSPGSRPIIFFAACLAIFFFAFFASMLLMLL